jgi:uncharacterized protein (DUF697 family)
MTIVLKKPILVAGISLSFLLWLWQSIQSHGSEIGGYTLWGLVVISSCFWLWLPKNNKNNAPTIVATPITTTKLMEVTAEINKLIDRWETEKKNLKSSQLLSENQLLVIAKEKDRLLTQLARLKEYSSENKLKVALTGHHKLSNYALANILTQSINPEQANFTVIDNLFTVVAQANLAKKDLSLNYDLVLFIIQGDLSESEKNILINCHQNRQKLLLLFNQIDYSSPEEKSIILKQLKSRINDSIGQDNLLTISTTRQIVKVKKYQDDNNYQEWEEKIEPQCDDLINKLYLIINNETQQLLLNTAYRKAIALRTEIKEKLNLVRKETALPLIEKYQIIAASATFANPVASLDLLATAAINTQMIIDLGNIYQHKLSLNQAQNVAVTLAKLMIKLGIVELSTQAITAILKTNAITFIAGGIIQGVSTAYLTRICGLSLIDYFATTELNSAQETINIDHIKTQLKSVFSQYQQQNILTKFVQKTAVKLAKQE